MLWKRLRRNDDAPATADKSLLNCGLCVGLVLVGLVPGPALFGQNGTAENERIVDGLNDHLAEVRDLSADFVQILDNGLNQPQREGGHLYLDRSGKARWEYDFPVTKLYVIDGNVVSDYLPGENLLRRRPVEDGVFDRMPLMSILGRANLRDEFARIDLLAVGAVESQVEGTRVLRLIPRRDSDVGEVVLEVDPASFDIRRLRMRYQDGATNDFLFNNVLTNTGFTDALWQIVPAPGTDIVDLVN